MNEDETAKNWRTKGKKRKKRGQSERKDKEAEDE